MKILHFVCDGAPGGGTNHVVQLLSGLGAGYECALLTESESYLSGMAKDIGVETFSGSFFRGRTDRVAMNRVKEVIAEYQPDVVHCHGGRAAFFYGCLNDSTTSFYTVHGFHFKRKSVMPRCLGWAGEYFSIRRADNIVFVSEYDQKLAVSAKLLPKGKAHKVIHNGIAKPASRPGNEKLGVGFVGRMVFQKHPELFLDVMERLPGVQAVMAGDGELEPRIREMIHDRGLEEQITLLGGLPHAQSLDVIANLDALVMTPRWEGLPLLPLEAMLLNVPVVSTPVGGIPEVIEHGVTGWLGNNADELAEGVRKILDNDASTSEIVKAAYEKASREFSQQKMVAQLRDFYQQAFISSSCNATV